MNIPKVVMGQYSSLPISLTPQDCRGKTYIVTGSNIGLGLNCAKHLVKLEARRVIMAVRSVTRGKEALATIEAETRRKGVAEVWELDLASYESIKKFAARVQSDLDRVDALVGNAAVATATWAVAEGFESHMTVNVVGTVLLTVMLLPYLRNCAQKLNITPRVSIVTSGLAFGREVDLSKIKGPNILEELSDREKWPIDINRYSLSKLIQVFAVRRLAVLAPYSKTGVVINILEPGLCSTGLTRNADTTSKILVGLLRAAIGRSAEWGSRNLLYGIAADEESHGRFLSYCQDHEAWIPDFISNKNGEQWSRRVWDELAIEFEKVQPGCVREALEL